ncbi:19743_t:CDS:2 [Funneliformis geosporum]|uniref:19743_t:CDS:1 n=1 Tax=Funneliformis geosporum TaxID=1117311 RepID=A0A9W4SEN2_9GLOM|nr:19743_t:CDS:2 [Funneliformis geosporum]
MNTIRNPEARYVHSSVLVGSRIYFFGGEKVDSEPVNEVFYLDVSQEFHIASAPWTDLTASAAIPFLSSWATVTTREVNNNQIIYLFGGYMLDPTTSKDSFTSIIHTFNTTSIQWSTPQIQGTVPQRRRNIDSVLDDSGNMYIFGGYYVEHTEPLQDMFNDMIIINTNTLSISPGSSQNGPSQRCAYTATLLPNGTIVYIGGYKTPTNGESPVVNITEIYLYDTKLDTWSLTWADNINSIESRYLHTAVLGR